MVLNWIWKKFNDGVYLIKLKERMLNRLLIKESLSLALQNNQKGKNQIIK